MTIRACISLLKEMKSIHFDYKKDKINLLENICETVYKLRGGRKVMKKITYLVIDDNYDEAIKYLRKSVVYSNFWPLNEVSWSDLGVSRILFVIFALLGLLNLSLWQFEYKHMKGSANWPSTTGIIIASELYVNTDDDDNIINYSPYVEFSYTIYGMSYTSDYLTFFSESGNKLWADSIIAQYPVSSMVQVFYHPQKHRLSVLKPGFDPNSYAMLIMGYGFILIGISIISIKVLLEMRYIKRA